ncbi:hypothetical protein SAMN05421636_104260 [Pricia antarctica]|uniref:Uncharacterized protein n=1 Tax=Pricia antarctica TaxID=641691 RepID=A0A1G7BR91_9FLAO|nr:hypothetical protein SAMN05421636_104260 [Pricia antarctica]
MKYKSARKTKKVESPHKRSVLIAGAVISVSIPYVRFGICKSVFVQFTRHADEEFGGTHRFRNKIVSTQFKGVQYVFFVAGR